MRRLKRSFSLVTRLLCIFALIGLNFAHNLNPKAIQAPSGYSHSQQNSGIGSHHLHSALVADICSKDSHSSDFKKIAQKQHDNSPCHSGVPCHACRIGSSMLTPPDSGEIGQCVFVEMGVLCLVKIDKPSNRFVNSNASPRSPPYRTVA